MINTDSMDESYLFQLEMLKDQISVINYIEKVVACSIKICKTISYILILSVQLLAIHLTFVFRYFFFYFYHCFLTIIQNPVRIYS